MLNSININDLVMMVMGGLMTFQWWQIKRYVTKVDSLETRVTKLETIMDLLGDIRNDIQTVKTDVEVIKSQLKS